MRSSVPSSVDTLRRVLKVFGPECPVVISHQLLLSVGFCNGYHGYSFSSWICSTWIRHYSPENGKSTSPHTPLLCVSRPSSTGINSKVKWLWDVQQWSDQICRHVTTTWGWNYDSACWGSGKLSASHNFQGCFPVPCSSVCTGTQKCILLEIHPGWSSTHSMVFPLPISFSPATFVFQNRRHM